MEPKSKTAAFRARQAANSRRWRQRLKRGRALYAIEVGSDEFALLERFGELRADQVDDRAAVAAALGRLLRRSLAALLHAERTPRR
jgi:hypothetical protein